jgi:hypothetical protein
MKSQSLVARVGVFRYLGQLAFLSLYRQYLSEAQTIDSRGGFGAYTSLAGKANTRLPSLSSTSVEFDLPEARLSEQAEAVLRAILTGAMSPTVGSDLLQSLAQAARIKETDELEERISRLESQG